MKVQTLLDIANWLEDMKKNAALPDCRDDASPDRLIQVLNQIFGNKTIVECAFKELAPLMCRSSVEFKTILN